MPGTTRYSATFDRPYEEEDDLPAEPPPSRRSRSQSLGQALPLNNGRPYTPLGGAYRTHARSSSSDNGPQGPPTGAEVIPTRTVGKASVKAHSNPFQFVKVGTSPLYKKAEEQLKKVKEVKKPEVFKEEEEEWQSNLDSWKSRRRKMSESAFRRLEEVRQAELEEQTVSTQPKKTKTFSEMVEERAHRGRTLSLCLISSPFEMADWITKPEASNESDNNSNDNQLSEESSVVNSEDDCDAYQKTEMKTKPSENGIKNVNNNGVKSKNESKNVKNQTVSNGVQLNSKTLNNNNNNKQSESDMTQETGLNKDDQNLNSTYIDSGLESLSSSHRAGDIPDSGSDFSQDSGSSLDCDSPRVSGLITTGVELLEEFSSKDDYLNNSFTNEKSGIELSLKMCLTENKYSDYGFSFTGGKDHGSAVIVNSIEKGSVSDNVGLKLNDHILAVNNEDVKLLTHSAIISLLNKAKQFKQLKLQLWRPFINEVKSPTTPVPISRKKSNENINNENHSNTENLKSKITSDFSSLGNCAKETLSSEKLKEVTKTESECKLVKSIADSLTNHNERSIESENEMYVDDFEELALINNAKNTSTFDSKGNHAASLSNSLNVAEAGENCCRKKPSYQSWTTKDGSLNLIYQSCLESGSLSSNEMQSSQKNTKPLIDEVPVEKVAEEMEKLILQQLEEEEQAKELAKSAGVLIKDGNQLSEQTLADIEVPPRHVEPPKEKPPPPPSSDSPQKQPGLKRINSTKRIKKEIQKRRSNFLGIDPSDDENAANKLSVPPPPALEDILKAEREHDRLNQGRTCTSLQSSFESDEIARKEREIIENLENEEKKKLEDEETRIQKLKEERQKMEEERAAQEEQRIRLEEARLLKEREEFLKKQELSDVSSKSDNIINKNKSQVNNSENSVVTDVNKVKENKKGNVVIKKVKTVKNEGKDSKKNAENVKEKSSLKENENEVKKMTSISSEGKTVFLKESSERLEKNSNENTVSSETVKAASDSTDVSIHESKNEKVCKNTIKENIKTETSISTSPVDSQTKNTVKENIKTETSKNIPSVNSQTKITIKGTLKTETNISTPVVVSQDKNTIKENAKTETSISTSVVDSQIKTLNPELEEKKPPNLVKVRKKSKKADNSTELSVQTSSAPGTNNAESSSDSSSVSSVNNNVSVKNGDGKNANNTNLLTFSVVENKKVEEPVVSTPPKPLKKKEVIRKERERLRQEQEALQREREEYRRKMQLEQEQMQQSPHNPHVSEAPASQVGSLPPAKPALPPPLTSLPHKTSAIREESYASPRLQSGVPHPPVVSQKYPPQNRVNHNLPSCAKPPYNEAWTHHKVPVVRKQSDSSSESRYNQNHWLIQEAEMRRIAEQKERQRVQNPADVSRHISSSQVPYYPSSDVEENSGVQFPVQRQAVMPNTQPLSVKPSDYSVHTPVHQTEQQWNYGQSVHPKQRKVPVTTGPNISSDKNPLLPICNRIIADPNIYPPTKPSRMVPAEKQEQMLSVSGKKRCSHCGEELGRGAAMIIESLQLYYHIHCFRCCVCQAQLGNGSCGTDVRVRNNKLHCHNCYSNDEAGLKFSQV